MRCDNYRQSLSAFTDGELSGIGAWNVRRHLCRCAECRAIQSDLAAIGTSAKARYSGTLAPQSLGVRFLAEAGNSVRLPVTQARHLLRQTLAAVSVSVAIVGFVIGSVSFYFSLQSTPAFAEVENALRTTAFQTMRMKGIMGQSDGGGAPYVEEVWARTQHPASVTTVREPGRSPSKTTECMQRMVYRYSFHGKTWKYVRSNPVWRRSVDDYAREWIVYKSLVPDIDSDRKFHWTKSSEIRAGKRLIRLDGTRAGWFLKPSDRASIILFADPQTHLLVSSERHFMIEGRECFMIWTSITYNETPPPHTFDDADNAYLP